MHLRREGLRQIGAVLLFCCVTIALACGETSGPDDGGDGNQGGPITIGDTVAASWGGEDTITYSVTPARVTAFAVYAKASGVPIIVEVTTVSDSLLTQIGVPANPSASLLEKHTRLIELAAGQTARIRVYRWNGTTGSFQLYASPVGTAPESVAPQIQAGDTVAGEGLSHPADVDRFFFHTAGAAEFAVFAQVFAGDVSVVIADSITGQQYGAMGFSADPVPGHLDYVRTAIFTVPANRTARIEVAQIDGPTSGGYEMHLYPVNRAPEDGPATFAIGDTVAETIENSADIDEFSVDLAGAAELIGYYQGSPVLNSSGLILIVDGPNVGWPHPIIQHAPSFGLEELTTGRFRTLGAGIVTVSVHLDGYILAGSASLPAPYLFALRSVNRMPEHVPAVLTPNDTVTGERIDHVGDIDEFTLDAASGDLYNGFIHSSLPAGGSVVRLSLSQNGVQLGNGAVSVAGDSALRDHFTGNRRIPADGPVVFSVEGNGYDIKDRAPYRLFPYQVNVAPEILPGLITPGDSLFGETIEFPGDIDSFSIAPRPEDYANFFLTRSNLEPGSFTLLELSGTGGIGFTDCPGPPWDTRTSCGVGFDPYSNGPAAIAIESDGRYRGAYGMLTYSISALPEGHGGLIVPGDTVASSLEKAGDVDVYQFAYSRGQLISVSLIAGPDVQSPYAIKAYVDRPPGLALQEFGNFIAGAETPISGTGRFELLASGTYSIRVLGGWAGAFREEVGSYRLILDTVSRAPESSPSAVVSGDSILTEALDHRGDVDEFVFSGTPGSEVQALFLSPFLPSYVTMTAWNVGDSVPFATGRNWALGRQVVPADGQIRIRIAEPRQDQFRELEAFSVISPYKVWFIQVNRAPEIVPATVSPGVQTGETVAFAGDVDEYTFDGTLNQVVVATIQAPQGFEWGHVVLEIVNPDDGSVMGSAITNDGTIVSTGQIVLPAAGVYLIRIRNADDTIGFGAYTFTLH